MMSLTELLRADQPLRTGCNLPKQPGDRVMVGTNRGPVFRIVHVHGELAWIRPESNGQEGLVALERLRVVD